MREDYRNPRHAPPGVARERASERLQESLPKAVGERASERSWGSPPNTRLRMPSKADHSVEWSCSGISKSEKRPTQPAASVWEIK